MASEPLAAVGVRLQGLQVASEPWAAVGTQQQALTSPLWNFCPTGLQLPILGSWAQNALFSVWEGFRGLEGISKAKRLNIK